MSDETWKKRAEAAEAELALRVDHGKKLRERDIELRLSQAEIERLRGLHEAAEARVAELERERKAKWCENFAHMLPPDWQGPCHVCETERERDEARVRVAELERELDEAKRKPALPSQVIDLLVEERDEARARVADLADKLAESDSKRADYRAKLAAYEAGEVSNVR